jgi:proteasome accessory factor C
MPRSSKISGTDRFNLMLSMVGYLMNHQDVPLADLARHFGVSEAEIRSAISTIWVSGVGNYGPVELYDFEAGQLEDNIVTLRFSPAMEEVPKLSARQVAAISTGLQYLSQLTGFAEKAEVDQLLQVLSGGSVTDVTGIMAATPGTVDADVEVVRKAIVAGVAIRCGYRNANDETSERIIDPLLLEAIDEVWYLRGFCHSRLEVRAFRLDRMTGAEVTNLPISEEAKAAEISEEIYVPRDTDVRVVLDLAPEALGIMADYQAVQIQELPNDGKRVAIAIGNLRILGPLVAKYAGYAKVVEPAEAREVVRNFALSALGEHSSERSQTPTE